MVLLLVGCSKIGELEITSIKLVSGQGYTIPETQHNELRTLIYDKKSF